MPLAISNLYANNVIVARELKLLGTNDIIRFNTKFIVIDINTCWLWLGSKRNNYGIFSVGKIKLGAHRISYALYYCNLIDTLEVLHTCDNSLCVNPNHLFMGTQFDNMQDKMRKGRAPKGEKHYATKITDIQIMELKHMYASGKYVQRQLATLFQLSQQHVSDILNGKYR